MTNAERPLAPVPGNVILPPDADAQLKGSLQAMLRAAQRARVVAQQTGTDLILHRDGAVVRVSPMDAPLPDDAGLPAQGTQR